MKPTTAKGAECIVTFMGDTVQKAYRTEAEASCAYAGQSKLFAEGLAPPVIRGVEKLPTGQWAYISAFAENTVTHPELEREFREFVKSAEGVAMKYLLRTFQYGRDFKVKNLGRYEGRMVLIDFGPKSNYQYNPPRHPRVSTDKRYQRGG